MKTPPDPKTNREKVFALMMRSRLIPVFSSPDQAINRKVLKGVQRSGCPIFEFTFRQECGEADFVDLLKFAVTEAPDVTIGVGTIKRKHQAERFRDLGAKFFVGPTWNDMISFWAKVNDLAYCPGGMTPTEIDLIFEKSGDNPWTIAKLYPGDFLKPQMLKSLLAANHPSLPMNIMVTGGVTLPTIPDWFNAGAVALGAGSILGTEVEIREGTEADIAARLRAAYDAVPAKFKPVWGELKS